MARGSDGEYGGLDATLQMQSHRTRSWGRLPLVGAGSGGHAHHLGGLLCRLPATLTQSSSGCREHSSSRGKKKKSQITSSPRPTPAGILLRCRLPSLVRRFLHSFVGSRPSLRPTRSTFLHGLRDRPTRVSVSPTPTSFGSDRPTRPSVSPTPTPFGSDVYRHSRRRRRRMCHAYYCEPAQAGRYYWIVAVPDDLPAMFLARGR
jgi:hypothetical protein